MQTDDVNTQLYWARIPVAKQEKKETYNDNMKLALYHMSISVKNNIRRCNLWRI